MVAGAPGIGRVTVSTLLRPEAGRDAIVALCDEAVRYGLKAVCVNGCWIGDSAGRRRRRRRATERPPG